MNLLAKIKSCGALLLGLAILYSCEEKGDFGLATDDVAPVEFNTTNVAIESSLVQLDSVITAYQGRFLVGSLNNTLLGNYTATGFLAINGRTGNIPSFDDDAKYDSVRIEFKINYMHDTSSTNRDLDLELFDITEEFEDTLYIASNSLEYSNRLLASGSFVIEDTDSVYAMLGDDAWGNELFNGLKNGSSNFENQENFSEYLPGIAFRAAADQGNVFGFTPGVDFRIRVYYNEPNADNTDVVSRYFEMNGFNMPYFFNVAYDRSATEFGVVDQTNTEYSGTNSLAVHSGSGLVTKLNLNQLVSFSETVQGAIINSAHIEIGPIEEPSNLQTLPNSLLLYLTDERNTRIRDGSSYRSIQQDGSSQLISNFPVLLRYNKETKKYSASITSFVKVYYQDDYRRDEYFLYPSDMNSTLRGFTFNKDNLSIKIFYSELR